MRKFNSKYENIIEKYNLSDISDEFHKLADSADVRQVSSMITGEANTLLDAISEFLKIPELKSIMFPGEYRLNLRYSEKLSFTINQDGDEKEVSFEEFAEQIQETSGLDASSPLFVGSIFSNNPILHQCNLFAASISSGFDDDLLMNVDSYMIALSATHFLSVKERNFIRNTAIPQKVIVICDIDKVHDEETEHVKSLILPYHSDTTLAFTQPLTDDDCDSIFTHLTNIPDMINNRIARIDDYLKCAITDSLTALLESKEKAFDVQKDIVTHINKATSNIVDYQSKTIRYVSTNYIENIKNNTVSKILDFYEKMNGDITEGVKEEKDLKSLQAELPNFIAGSWSEFVSNVLNGCVKETVDEVTPAIDAYIDDKADLFLKDILTDGEYARIKDVISKNINNRIISSLYAEQVSGQRDAFKNEGNNLRKILPKCLMALGGVVMLSSSFIPGAALMVAGIKGDRDAAKEIKEDLIVAGKKLNYQYLKEVQDNLDKLMERLNAEVSYIIERCYKDISDTLVELIPEYQKISVAVQSQITDIGNDIEMLKTNF